MTSFPILSCGLAAFLIYNIEENNNRIFVKKVKCKKVNFHFSLFYFLTSTCRTVVKCPKKHTTV